MDEAFSIVGLNPKDHVEFDPRFARPGNTSVLIGDHSKAREAFGFEPKVRMKELVKIMVDHDLAELEKNHQENVESRCSRTRG